MRGTVSRRIVVSGLISVPISVSAAPLVDLEKGGGLFSHKPISLEQRAEPKMMDIYTQQPTAELAEPDEPRPPRIATDRPSFAFVVRLKNTNTGEGLPLDVQASLDLGWIQRRRLNHFMRDWREDKVKRIDPSVVQDFLETCRAFTSPGNPIDVRVNSGYRSKKTNEMLRQRNRNVAINSLHIEGRAIDFALPGVSQRQLGAVANDICRGGVGTYNTFVHIDSGSNRRWST